MMFWQMPHGPIAGELEVQPGAARHAMAQKGREIFDCLFCRYL